MGRRRLEDNRMQLQLLLAGLYTQPCEMGNTMKRLLLFMIMLLLFEISARLELINLSQQRIDTKEHVHLMNSSAVALEIGVSKKRGD